jgi:hypothetical protein
VIQPRPNPSPDTREGDDSSDIGGPVGAMLNRIAEAHGEAQSARSISRPDGPTTLADAASRVTKRLNAILKRLEGEAEAPRAPVQPPIPATESRPDSGLVARVASLEARLSEIASLLSLHQTFDAPPPPALEPIAEDDADEPEFAPPEAFRDDPALDEALETFLNSLINDR